MWVESSHTVVTQSLLKHLENQIPGNSRVSCKAQSVSLASVMLLKVGLLSPWGRELWEAPTLPTQRVHVGQPRPPQAACKGALEEGPSSHSGQALLKPTTHSLKPSDFRQGCRLCLRAHWCAHLLTCPMWPHTKIDNQAWFLLLVTVCYCFWLPLPMSRSRGSWSKSIPAWTVQDPIKETSDRI